MDGGFTFDPTLSKKRTKHRTAKVKPEVETRYNTETVGRLTIFHPIIPEGLLQKFAELKTRSAQAGAAGESGAKEEHHRRRAFPYEDYGLSGQKRAMRFPLEKAEEVYLSAVHAREAEAPDAKKLEICDGDLSINYDDMLAHIFQQLSTRKAGSTATETDIPDPKTVQVGTKRTQIVNLEEICKALHRPIDHVSNFLQAEFKQQGALDGGVILFKCRLQPQQVRNAFKAYQAQYVTCYGCKSGNTMLSKDGKQTYVRCSDCGAFRSVAAIKR